MRSTALTKADSATSTDPQQEYWQPINVMPATFSTVQTDSNAMLPRLVGSATQFQASIRHVFIYWFQSMLLPLAQLDISFAQPKTTHMDASSRVWEE